MGQPTFSFYPDPTNPGYPGATFARITWPDGRWTDVNNHQMYGQNWQNLAAALYCGANTGAAPGSPGHPSPYPGFPRPPSHPQNGSPSPSPGNSIPLPDGTWFTPDPGVNPGPYIQSTFSSP